MITAGSAGLPRGQLRTGRVTGQQRLEGRPGGAGSLVPLTT